MPSVLSVQNLTKTYPGKKPFTAVDGISFELAPQEILGLLGANGAGKTTTIQMLLSTLKPTSGSIVYFDKDFLSYRSEILQHVSFASTYVSLPHNLSVKQNLNVFGKFYGLSFKEIKERAYPLLERFGILHKLSSHVTELSAGQVTRLVLVKAFMVRPQVAPLDEPTASLDPDVAKDVVDFVLEQRNQYGMSILYTSHNMAEVSEVCDRVLFMSQGKIVADGTPKQLVRSVLSSKLTLQFTEGLSKALEIAINMQLKYTVQHRSLELELDEEHIAAYLSALASEGVLYTHISVKEPSLEDYFLHMAGKR